MVKKGDLSPDELKTRFTTLVSDMEAAILTADKPIPTIMQDIPELFEGWEGKVFPSTYKAYDKPAKQYKLDTTKVVKVALWIAKQYDLVPRDTPLRQVWYSFIKLATILLLKRVTSIPFFSNLSL